MMPADGADRPATLVDPALAESAVWTVLCRTAAEHPERVAAHGRRAAPAYAIEDPVGRDAAFGRLALAEFAELDLAGPIRQALDERPALAGRVTTILIGEARGRHDEGVICERGGEHLGIRVEGWRLADPVALLAWARHALGHAEDTLDPAFDFEPGWDEGSSAPVRSAAAARLHRLWDVTVDARLAASGWPAGPAQRAWHRDRLASDLPGVNPAAVDAVLARLWDGPRPTFADLLDWAVRPASLVAAVAPHARLLRHDSCPLCGFPSDDVAPPPAAVARQVAIEYPDWRPDDGLCGRCGDRVRLVASLGGAR
jgi:hypothetical protein